MSDHLFQAVDIHPLIVPLSCGSGESSTGALWVRYWEEPWDFLRFWAFLTDFLVKPSTFSDAEMADILMRTLIKISHKLLYPQVVFSSRWHRHRNMKQTLRIEASPVQLLCYSMWYNMVGRCRGYSVSKASITSIVGKICFPKHVMIFKRWTKHPTYNISWHCPVWPTNIGYVSKFLPMIAVLTSLQTAHLLQNV